jgi:cell fate (sporulation/competence/biofilm development) regulator YlbF (YheA/YmcA/DUF963 family)
MEDTNWNELEVAPSSTVMQAARQFAQIFSNTPQFLNFEQAYTIYSQDKEAQNALRELQLKQASLKAVLMLNALTDEERTEMQKLQERFYNQPSVIGYAKTQEELIAMSQEIGDLLSKAIGLDYGSSCRTGGCCG